LSHLTVAICLVLGQGIGVANQLLRHYQRERVTKSGSDLF
jgi:hypothetical protein